MSGVRRCSEPTAEHAGSAAAADPLELFVSSVSNFLKALRTKFRKDEQASEKIDRLQRQMQHMVLGVPDTHKPIMRRRCVEEFHKTMSPLYGRIERNDHSIVAEINNPLVKDMEFDRLFLRCNEPTRTVVLAHLNAMRAHAVLCMESESVPTV